MYRLNQEQLLKGTQTGFVRYLYKRIKWKNRLIGIRGGQGVGKTTLLLQRIKLTFGDSTIARYLPLDNIWFQQETLTEVVCTFYREGGRFLFLDNVHRYPSWEREVETLYTSYPDLSIVFAAPSWEFSKKGRKKIKEEVDGYTLHTMSFREHLAYESILDMKPIPLEEVLLNHAEIVKQITSQMNVTLVFRNYLKQGCYPFYWEDPDAFPFRLQNLIRDSVDKDFATAYSLDPETIANLKKCLLRLTEFSWVSLKTSEIVEKIGFNREVLRTYLAFLEKMGWIRIFEVADSPVQNKIRNIYFRNPNLLAALSRDENRRMQIGETFFTDQMSMDQKLSFLGNHDFIVNDQFLFQVGDPLMNYNRIKEAGNTYAAVYGLPKSVNNKMPIWVLGLCY